MYAYGGVTVLGVSAGAIDEAAALAASRDDGAGPARGRPQVLDPPSGGKAPPRGARTGPTGAQRWPDSGR